MRKGGKENEKLNRKDESAERYWGFWLEASDLGLGFSKTIWNLSPDSSSPSWLRRERNPKLPVTFVKSSLPTLQSASVGGKGSSVPHFHFTLMDPLSRLLLSLSFHTLRFSCYCDLYFTSELAIKSMGKVH